MDPARDRRSPTPRRMAVPARSPPRTIASLPRRDGDQERDGREVRPACRRRAEQRRDDPRRAETAEHGASELEAPDRRVEDRDRPGLERVGHQQHVAEPPAHHGTRRRPDGDEEQVVGAQAMAAGHDAEGRQADDGDEREGERLPANGEIAELDEWVEVERDDGDRHGRRSVPAAQVSSGRHLPLSPAWSADPRAGHTMSGIRLTALGAQTVAMRGNTSVVGGPRWTRPDVRSSGMGRTSRRIWRTPWPLGVAHCRASTSPCSVASRSGRRTAAMSASSDGMSTHCSPCWP